MSPQIKSSKINESETIELDGHSIYITSILKETDLSLDNLLIPKKVKPQELYSPLRCKKFTADPYSISYFLAKD